MNAAARLGLTLLLALANAGFLSDAQAADRPSGAALSAADDAAIRATAKSFYEALIASRPSGLPSGPELERLRRYLSRDLLQLMERASRRQAAFQRAHPDDKPPLVDGCIFSCLFEGPQWFALGAAKRDGRTVRLEAKLSGEPAGKDPTWTDTVALVEESGGWRISDIRMGCTWPFRMGPTLRAMLKDV